MTKNKTTKRALLASAVSLILCFSMLLGTTYAWFTDSVTSTNNKIVAGNLDVDLYLWTAADASLEITEESDPIFGAGSLAQNVNAETLWEPGKTQVAYLSIKNNGSLDLKYSVALKVENVAKNLFEVMQYDIIENAKFDEVDEWTSGSDVVAGTQRVSAEVPLAAGVEHFFALAIHMDETAGNEYQDGQVNFDLSVLATQLTSEVDSFDDQYDKFATVDNKAELLEALNADYDLITLGGDIAMAGESLVIPANKTLTLDLNGYAITDAQVQTAAHAMINNKGTLTIKDSVGSGKIAYEDNGVGGNYVSNTISNTGTLTITGGRFENNSPATNDGYPHVLDNFPGAVTTINGGTFYGKTYSTVRLFCNSTTLNTKVTINDGTFIGRVDFQNPNTSANLGELTINGGSFTENNSRNWAMFIFGSGDATDSSNMKLAITGGSFDGIIKSDYSGLEIGTNFNTKFVTGGTFTVSPAAYVPTGYSIDEKNGKFTVLKGVTASTNEELADLIDNAKDGDVINLVENFATDITIPQEKNVNFTIDGGGHEYKGTILVDGGSSAHDGAGIVIQNVTFVVEDSVTSGDSCIYLGKSGDNNTRYTNNVTIKNCRFIGTSDYAYNNIAAIRTFTGGDKNLSVVDCVAEGIHSLLQIHNIKGKLTVSGCEMKTKNGMNLNNCTNVEIDDCTVDVLGYGARFGVATGGEPEAPKTFVVKNSSFKSAHDDNDALFVFRASAQNAVLTVTNTEMCCDTDCNTDVRFSGNTSATTITVDGTNI